MEKKNKQAKVASFVYCFLDSLLAFAEELAAAGGHRILIAISAIIIAGHPLFSAHALHTSSHSQDL